MAETAFEVIYRDEWIADFERYQAKLRTAVTTNAMISGRQATFLIASSNREAVTRGSNGLIPASADDLTQSTVTLAEAHDLSQKTNFNIFAGQSDQRAIMQAMGRKVINRDIDNKIITALNTATGTVNSTATIVTKGLVNQALVQLGEADVPTDDGMLYAAVSNAAWGHLLDIPSFASADYVSDRPMEQGFVEMRRWMGITWMRHNALPGTSTSSCKNFIWYKDSVGWAYNSADVQALAGYHEEQDYSWARTTIYHGALLLKNAGVAVLTIDDTAV